MIFVNIKLFTPAACRDTGPRAAPSTPPITICGNSDKELEQPHSSTSQGEVDSPSYPLNPDLCCPPSQPLPPNLPRDPTDGLSLEQDQDRTQPRVFDKFEDVIQVQCDTFCPPLISDDINVKGRLKSCIEFWSLIGAHVMITSIIAKGYFIPFIENPPYMAFSNNSSALRYHEFVTNSVLELLSSGRIKEIASPSYVVSPLSVSCQNENKKRLILDLSMLNKFVRTQQFKIDDWKIGLQYFSPNSFLFSFDLKSGYHHIEIAPQHHTFLASLGAWIGYKDVLNSRFYPLGYLLPISYSRKCSSH